MQGEHDPTTRDLVKGARDELLSVGQAAFTMDAVARRSFYSAGALYERWPDRADLLADVARTVQVDLERELDGLSDAATAITWALEEGGQLLALVGEVLLAGHSMAPVRPLAIDM